MTTPLRDDSEYRVSMIDKEFEQTLVLINQQLSQLEKQYIKGRQPGELPPLLILCFPPRSGSTYLAQLMARTRCFNYITNFIARFWEAPYLAGLIEKKIGLRSADFPEEINSSFGVTPSPNDPHEFGFFWKRWLEFMGETHVIDENAIGIERINQFKEELDAVRALYNKPMFLKNSIVGLNPSFFEKHFENVFFLVLKRTPEFIAQSIYNSRIQIYGDENIFWSLRPSNYGNLKTYKVLDQIVYQIKGIYDDIYSQLENINSDFIEITYEDLVLKVDKELKKIVNFVNSEYEFDKKQLPQFSKNPSNLNKIYIDKKIFSQIREKIDSVFH